MKIGRLAMRVEGSTWSAYYALEGTMTGAVFLGSIRMAAVTNNPDRKQAFMDMMRDLVADILEEKTGERPTWGCPETAPAHEQSGNA